MGWFPLINQRGGITRLYNQSPQRTPIFFVRGFLLGFKNKSIERRLISIDILTNLQISLRLNPCIWVDGPTGPGWRSEELTKHVCWICLYCEICSSTSIICRISRASQTASCHRLGFLAGRSSSTWQVDQWDFANLQEFANLSVSIHPPFCLLTTPRFIKKFLTSSASLGIFSLRVPHRPTVSKDVVRDGHGQPRSSMIFWESQTFTTSSLLIMVIINGLLFMVKLSMMVNVS